MSELDLTELMQALDARIRALERLPDPSVRDEVFVALQLVDGLHRAGLKRLAERLQAQGAWESLLEEEAIKLLFTLYDLVPQSEADQVEMALEPVRPYIHAHGGVLEVLQVEDGVVHLTLRGACQSCSASSATLTRGVEAALKEGFPSFRGMVVHEPEKAQSWVELPMARGGERPLQAPVFKEVARVAALPQDRPTLIQLGEKAVLLARVGAEAYAYEATCPACDLSLEGAELSGHVLVCPWQNCAYDVRSGRRADDGSGAGLRVYPVGVQNGRVLLAANVAPQALFAEKP